jgi:membrane protein
VLFKPSDPSPPDDRPSRGTRLALAAERRLSRISWWLTQRYAWLDEATEGLLPLLTRAWVDFNQRDTRYAASLAYYALFSIFPLILLGATLFSGVLGSGVAEEQLLDMIGDFFPPDTVRLIQSNVQRALQQRHSFSLVALIGLGWSALSMFSNLTVAIDNIFHPTRWRPLWHKRLLALIMVIALAVLLLASLFTSLGIRLITMLMLDRPNTAMWIVNVFLPLGLNMTIFALLFRRVPRVHVRWDAIWPAAVVGAVGWELSQSLFVWYLDNFSTFSVIYGSLGTVIILLLWIYLSSAILLLAAELCNALNTWYNQRQE